MKNILKSKSLIIFIICVIGVAGLSAVLKISTPDINEAINPADVAGKEVKTIIPIKDYKEINIYDSEEGIFLAEKYDIYENFYQTDVIDKNGKILNTYNNYGRLYQFTDDYLIFSYREYDEETEDFVGPVKSTLVNFTTNPEDKKVEETYGFASINTLTGDLLLEKDTTFDILDKDRKLLYQLPKENLSSSSDRYDTYRVDFVGTEDYITAINKDMTSSLINYKTGEEEFRTEPDSEIWRRDCSKWVVFTWRKDHQAMYSFYNDDFTPAFDGKYCNSYLANENFISFVEVNENCNPIGDDIVYSKNNKIVKTSGPHGKAMRGFLEDDIIIFSNGTNKCEYYKITEEGLGEKITSTPNLCFMDFEDGSAVVAEKTTNYDDSFNTDLLYTRTLEEYHWGFVDENFEPLTKVRFNFASTSENGYAVVGITKGYDQFMGVIDLKKDRGEM